MLTAATVRYKLMLASSDLVRRGDHVIKLPLPRSTTHQPMRRLQGATRENRAVSGAVPQFQPLALTDQHGRVLANNIAATYDSETDAAIDAFARRAFAAVYRCRF